jgi:hypothetical protein
MKYWLIMIVTGILTLGCNQGGSGDSKAPTPPRQPEPELQKDEAPQSPADEKPADSDEDGQGEPEPSDETNPEEPGSVDTPDVAKPEFSCYVLVRRSQETDTQEEAILGNAAVNHSLFKDRSLEDILSIFRQCQKHFRGDSSV